MRKISILIVFLSIHLQCLWAQKETVLVSEGFIKGIFPSGWSVTKGVSINVSANITSEDSIFNQPGIYGISMNTQGYYLQLPELESCGTFRFSYRGSSSPSNLGFKVQKMIAGASNWEDIAVYEKPISGNKGNITLKVNEHRKTKLRIFLHDRASNTLYIDNVIATSYVNPNILNLKTDRERIDFGNCISDSTLSLSFLEWNDSIEWLDLSIHDEGFTIQNRINLKVEGKVEIRFVGTKFRAYETILEIKLGDRIKNIPIIARRVSGTYMTLLTDMVYGEDHADWVIKGGDNNSYYLIGSSPDSIFVPINNLSNCKALQLQARLRTYNGNNQQYLRIEGRNSDGLWLNLGKIIPNSSSFATYEWIIPLDEEVSALRFETKTPSHSFKIGVESITVNGAFGNALTIDKTHESFVRFLRHHDSSIGIYSDSALGCVRVFNIQGQIILQKEIPLDRFSINLPKGIYIIKVNNRVVKLTI